ncbi:conserved unknown protein [Ectocarpus siliculosus]|uniref:Pentacotripeptide-repeat region of PRORP domain-containing protein n=1 Tax=Ectocarpus siliculosus TaxID=2880 RepID=D7FWM3_ECTSI|nr:conserved unknown protein [Ectocarpus siliculosus]|eukprot:CBJ32111.1 conserved unknown protein [Ectocarpus siliculosus]
MVHASAVSPAFLHTSGSTGTRVAFVAQQTVQRERRSLAPKLSTRSRAPVTRRPQAPRGIVSSDGGSGNASGGGGGGIVVGPAAGHSEEQVAWLGRLDYYGGRQMWRKAEDKFQQMQDEGVYPTLPLCNSLMEAYLKGKRYVNAVGFLEDLCLGNILSDVAHDGLRGAKVSPAASGSSGSSSSSSEEEAGETAVATAPIVPNLRTFNLVLATLASAGKWKKALDVSAPMRAGKDPAAGSGSGGGRGRGGGGGRGKGDLARNAVKSVAGGLTADSETYTHLIVACGKGGEPDRSRQLFDEMRSRGISPPAEATAALIKALAKGGRGSSEALRLLGDMRAAAQGGAAGRSGGVYLGDGMPSDGMDGAAREKSEAAAQSLGFEGAIEACAVNGEWQKAVSLLDEMRQARMYPDARCYGNAMRACAAGGNWQLSLALLNTMKKEGVTRTAFNYNIAMQACRKAERNKKAISLLDEMEKDGVAPDIVTYNTCVTIAGQAGRLDQALELLRRASEEGGLELDVVSYRAALGGLRREKRWEAAVKLLGDMQRRGLGPDEVCTAMAMNTCVAAQQPLRALDLFRDMRDVGRVFPRISSVTALLEAHAALGRWEDALVELRALSASGVKPDGRAIAFAMAACNAARKWEQTISLYHYALKMGIESSMEGLVLVARAYGAGKDWQAVLGVLATAEEACSSAAAAAAAANDRGGERAAAVPAVKHPPAELYEVAARSLALAGMWEEAASAVRRLEKLSPRKTREGAGAAARTSAAGLGTYEMILGAALAAGCFEAVLAQADAARAALRDASSSPSSSSGYDHGASQGGQGRGGGGGVRELNPGALAHEAAAAGRLGQWDRVSPLLAKAMRSPDLRGVAGCRLYAALITAAAACGKPRRGLEVFQEMVEESRSGGGGGSAGGNGDGVDAAVLGAAAAVVSGGVEWSDSMSGEDGTTGEVAMEEAFSRSGGGGERRLPPPDGATFLAALDACAAVGGEESVTLAIGVTKDAAAAAREFQRPAGGGGGGDAKKPRLSSRQLAAVLSKAGEVCAAVGKESTAIALAAKAEQLVGEAEAP